MKIAVIDIGSNSVRLMLVADGNVLYKKLKTTRLGEGIANGTLKSEAIERTAQAVSAFYNLAKAENAKNVYAFATAAVRSAQNRADFLERVKTLCGLEIEVISGEKEAEIGILGALGDKDGGIIDVGGASTEIIVKKNSKVLYSKSIDVGVVRLKDACGRDLSLLRKACEEKAKEFGLPPVEKQMIAIGGTATTLGALYLDLKEYSSKAVTGTRITKAELDKQLDCIAKSSVEELALHPCVDEKRADVLLGGVVLLSVIMEKYEIAELVISDCDNLEGYAADKGLLAR